MNLKPGWHNFAFLKSWGVGAFNGYKRIRKKYYPLLVWAIGRGLSSVEAFFLQFPRWVWLLVTALASMGLFWLVFDGPLGSWIKATKLIQSADDTGSALRYLLPVLQLAITAPMLFVLWLWRDQNQRAAIENQRKDTLLKEFQEIQKQAGGFGTQQCSGIW